MGAQCEYQHSMARRRVTWGLQHVIRALRDQRGWSQEDLAERASVVTNTISRIERGSVTPDTVTLEKIARAFDLSVVELLQEVPAPDLDEPAPSLSDEQARWIALWDGLHPDARRFAVGIVQSLNEDARRARPPSHPSSPRSGHKAS